MLQLQEFSVLQNEMHQILSVNYFATCSPALTLTRCALCSPNGWHYIRLFLQFQDCTHPLPIFVAWIFSCAISWQVSSRYGTWYFVGTTLSL